MKILKKVENIKFEYNPIYELINNYNQLILFIDYIKTKLEEKVQNIDLEIKLNIKENINDVKNFPYKNIICEYSIVKPLIKNMKSYSDSNILNYKNYYSFKEFLNDIIKNINN